MKLNFFSKVYLAITDFRLYPFIVQKEKFINALAYFTTFIFFISVILSTVMTVKILDWTDDFLNVYTTEISDFVVESGELNIDNNMNFEFYGVQIYANDDVALDKFNTESFDTMDCDIGILALKDAVAIGSENVGYVVSKYNNETVFSKDSMYNFLNTTVNNPVARISFGLAVFCGVFVAYLITKSLNLLWISLILLLLGHLFRTKYKYKHYLQVACYVVTLPIITEILALTITGSTSDYAYITYSLLLYIYMYYAVRALKLDDIITTTHEKLFKMKKTDSKDIFGKDKAETKNESDEKNIVEDDKFKDDKESNDKTTEDDDKN